MTTLASQFVTRQQPVIVADCAGDLIVNQFFIDLKAADLVAGNLIDIGILPAGHAFLNAHLVPDDLDTNAAPTITLDVGIMSGIPGDTTGVRTVGQELFVASNAAQTGAPIASGLKSMYTLPAVAYDRSIGVKIVAGPATAAAGRIRLIATLFATNSGFQF
jgi:hypothetical protein